MQASDVKRSYMHNFNKYFTRFTIHLNISDVSSTNSLVIVKVACNILLLLHHVVMFLDMLPFEYCVNITWGLRRGLARMYAPRLQGIFCNLSLNMCILVHFLDIYLTSAC